MLAALVTLNPVGTLCFNQPIAPNLTPLVPSLLCSPSNWQSCIGRRSSQRRRRCRRHRARRHTGHRGGRSGVPVLRARSRRRCWPRSRHAPSPGSYLPCSTVAWPLVQAPASGCLRKCNTAAITAAARSGQQDQPKPDQKSSRISLDRYMDSSG